MALTRRVQVAIWGVVTLFVLATIAVSIVIYGVMPFYIALADGS